MQGLHGQVETLAGNSIISMRFILTQFREDHGSC